MAARFVLGILVLGWLTSACESLPEVSGIPRRPGYVEKVAVSDTKTRHGYLEATLSLADGPIRFYFPDDATCREVIVAGSTVEYQLIGPQGQVLRAAAVELGHDGIRVNAVSPGATRTTMTKPFLEGNSEMLDPFRRRIPLKRFADPPEIAAVIVFLASPAASFVTGAVVPVDGGVTANVGQFPAPD